MYHSKHSISNRLNKYVQDTFSRAKGNSKIRHKFCSQCSHFRMGQDMGINIHKNMKQKEMTVIREIYSTVCIQGWKGLF